MSRRHSRERPAPDRLYRDTDHAMLAGVCAGIAEYLGVGRCLVRLIALVGLIFFTAFTLIAYLALAFLLPRRPAELYDDELDREFWQSVRRSPRRTLAEVRHRFRELERRLQRMERRVTSRRYRLDREFRDLRP